MSDDDMKLLIEVQRLPLTSKPFAEIARRLDMTEDEVISSCKALHDKGVIRSFGPSIAHRRVGYSANPMTAIKVPENRLEEVGNAIASEPDVTHCYHREGWDFDIFFMVHGKDKEKITERVHEIMAKVGVERKDYKLFFSIKEFKKTPFELQKELLNNKNKSEAPL
jgi:DNA-binding Lrp family transcriptional regulator